jgi:hypothetical protein
MIVALRWLAALALMEYASRLFPPTAVATRAGLAVTLCAVKVDLEREVLPCRPTHAILH